MRAVVAPDKFRGTASASEAAAALAAPLRELGVEVDEVPLADGGEGLLDALGGANRRTQVSGPLGEPVDAGWRFDGRTAVIEMARASGLELAGGARHNDAVAASTRGTGELIVAALEAGARRIVVGVGGSATTDGGLGAVEVVPPARLRGVEVVVACDVRLGFVDAAEVFAPQKGASPSQVALLRRRLDRLVELYRERFGVDVADLAFAGAAGGLAGGLAALGARLESGFELVADEVRLADRLEGADLVVTGEGYLDAESFDGKVVGGVAELAAAAGVPLLVVVGDRDPGVGEDLDVVALVERFGREAATGDTERCLREAVTAWAAGRSFGP